MEALDWYKRRRKMGVDMTQGTKRTTGLDFEVQPKRLGMTQPGAYGKADMILRLTCTLIKTTCCTVLNTLAETIYSGNTTTQLTTHSMEPHTRLPLLFIQKCPRLA